MYGFNILEECVFQRVLIQVKMSGKYLIIIIVTKLIYLVI